MCGRAAAGDGAALAAAAEEGGDREGGGDRELSAGEERVRQLQEGRDAAQKELAQAREDRDSLQNVLNGYGLRLESRRIVLAGSTAA